MSSANSSSSSGPVGICLQIRRDTAANWSQINPVLLDGEFGYDQTNKRIKIGDGVTPWNELHALCGQCPSSSSNSSNSSNSNSSSAASVESSAASSDAASSDNAASSTSGASLSSGGAWRVSPSIQQTLRARCVQIIPDECGTCLEWSYPATWNTEFVPNVLPDNEVGLNFESVLRANEYIAARQAQAISEAPHNTLAACLAACCPSSSSSSNGSGSAASSESGASVSSTPQVDADIPCHYDFKLALFDAQNSYTTTGNSSLGPLSACQAGPNWSIDWHTRYPVPAPYINQIDEVDWSVSICETVTDSTELTTLNIGANVQRRIVLSGTFYRYSDTLWQGTASKWAVWYSHDSLSWAAVSLAFWQFNIPAINSRPAGLENQNTWSPWSAATLLYSGDGRAQSDQRIAQLVNIAQLATQPNVAFISCPSSSSSSNSNSSNSAPSTSSSSVVEPSASSNNGSDSATSITPSSSGEPPPLNWSAGQLYCSFWGNITANIANFEWNNFSYPTLQVQMRGLGSEWDDYSFSSGGGDNGYTAPDRVITMTSVSSNQVYFTLEYPSRAVSFRTRGVAQGGLYVSSWQEIGTLRCELSSSSSVSHSSAGSDSSTSTSSNSGTSSGANNSSDSGGSGSSGCGTVWPADVRVKVNFGGAGGVGNCLYNASSTNLWDATFTLSPTSIAADSATFAFNGSFTAGGANLTLNFTRTSACAAAPSYNATLSGSVSCPDNSYVKPLNISFTVTNPTAFAISVGDNVPCQYSPCTDADVTAPAT